MNIIHVVTGALAVNTYIIYLPDTKEGILIDPGSEPERIYAKIQENKIHITSILLTHGHFDHIGAALFIKEIENTKITVHEHDVEMLEDPCKNLSAYMGNNIQLTADTVVHDKEILSINNFKIEVIHTPGHTPGSVCYKIQDHLFTGDTLFKCSVGRTDLPGGNSKILKQAIHQKLLCLDGNYFIYPGHGEVTTLEYERHNNPFI